MRRRMPFCGFLLAFLAVVPGFSQSPVAIEVGIHGGAPIAANLESAFCCTTGAAFVRVEPRDASYAGGLSAGVVLSDRFHFSFNATYMPVSFLTIGTTCCPIANPSFNTHGSSWEFPVLFDYRWLSGSLRPFTGGGLVVYNRTTGGEKQSPAPAISAGVEWVKGPIVIRPEFRYIHYAESRGSDISVARAQEQRQILLGIIFRR
jgi:hypothetical protein